MTTKRNMSGWSKPATPLKEERLGHKEGLKEKDIHGCY